MTRLRAGLRRYRWWLVGVGGPVILVAAIAIALPYVVRAELADWLRQDGAREASVERVAIHYLDSQIEVFGVRSTDKDGKVLRFDRIALAIDFPALFDRRVHVRALAFEGGAIEVTQGRGGAVSLAGIPTSSSPEPSPAPPSDSKPWLIGIDATEIGSLAIRLHAPDGAQDFKIENARLGAFAMWAGEANTALQLAGALGEGSLAVSGEASPLGASPSAAIDLEIKAFDLGKLSFLPGMEGLKGMFAGQLKIRAAVGRDGATTLHLTGDATVNGLELSGGPALGAASWNGEADVAAQKTGALTAQVKGRLALENLAMKKNTIAAATIDDLDLDLSQDPAKDALTVRMKGKRLVLEKLAVENNTLAAATIDDLDLDLSQDSAKGMDADVTGSFDLTKASFDLGDSKGGAERLRWKGKLHLADTSAGGERIEAKGDLAIETPRFAAPDDEVTLSRVGYDGLDATVTQGRDGTLGVKAAGAITGRGAKMRLGRNGFAIDTITWKGGITLASAPGKEMEIGLDGEMANKGSTVDWNALGYRVTQQETSWKGTATLGDTGVRNLAATARLTGTSVDAPAKKLRLLHSDALALDELTLDASGRIKIKRVDATVFRVFGAPGATAPGAFIGGVATLAAETIEVALPESITARRVAIDGAQIEIERDDKGKLRLTGLLAALGGEGGQSGSAPLPRMAVGELTLGGQSDVQFADHSVDPPAKIALGTIKLRLGALDSGAPDRTVPIDLAANIGRYAELNLKGNAKPFTDKINVDLQGKLTGFELSSLSGYLNQFLGYDLSRGRLDSDLHVKVVDGTLDTTSHLIITNLVLTQGRNDTSRALQKNLGIPIETALSLLRNSDDVIELSVPITGDVMSPDFDVSDAINTAIGNAMKRTVMTLIFPIGGLIAIAESGDAGLKFKSVAFAGGEVDIDADGRQNLDAIAKLLAERTGVRITACGVSTQKDADDILRVRQQKALIEASKTSQPPEASVPVTRDDLYDLSQRRSEAVKDYLIGRPGVTEARVFTCAPNIADDANAQPHADITL